MLAFPDSEDPRTVETRNQDLVAADGTVLAATLSVPRRKPHGTVIIHGAVAVRQGYYRRFAHFLSEAAAARVLTYDYRGVGRSRPRSLRGYEASMDDWATLDAAAAHAYVRDRFPGEPVVIVGHSWGGQLLGLLEEAREASAAILIGAQLGYYGHWSGLPRARFRLMVGAAIPALTRVFGYLPGWAGLGEDLPRGAALQWARWCSHPGYLISEHPDAHARFARFDRPVLFYSFTDDAYAPEPAVSSLLARLSTARLDHVRIDPSEHGGEPIGHFGFFRSRFAPTLWWEAADFARDALDGQSPRRRPAPALPLIDEVLSDLQYGRA